MTPSGIDAAKRLDELFQPWNRSDAPGLVAGIAQAGHVIYRRGFGLASIEHAVGNTPRTRMRIGSTSKHFAALAALLLEEEGRLDLDAQVRAYLPELDGAAGEPTLRQLITHTGGVRDPYDLPGILLLGSFPVLPAAGMDLEMTRRFASGNFAPGERMIYSNNGYYLVSLVIERISGETFEAFLKNRIFAPLGMNATELLRSDMQMITGIASFHLPQPDGSYRRGIYPSEELLGSGGVVSTVDDMLAWLAHLRGEKRIGSARSWEQMLERPRYNNGALSDYCLGLTREHYRGVEIVHHAGAVLGCTCQMLTAPAHALDIIIMCNRMDANPSTLALKVIDALLDDAVLQPAAAPLTAQGRENFLGRWYAPQSHRVVGVVAHPQPASPEPVLALSIHHALGGWLKQSGDTLVMTSPAHGTVELRAGKKPETLDVTDSGNPETFHRLPAAEPGASEVASELTGRYHYADFDRELAVILEDGKLYLDLRPAFGRSRLALEAFSRDVFGWTLTGTGAIPLPITGTLAVERNADQVRGLWLNNPRTRNLWLERLA